MGCRHPLLLLPRKCCHLLNRGGLDSCEGLDHLGGWLLLARLLDGSLSYGFIGSFQLLLMQGNQFWRGLQSEKDQPLTMVPTILALKLLTLGVICRRYHLMMDVRYVAYHLIHG